MAKGTRMKQLENQMEAMDVGLTQTQEVVTQSKEEMRTIREELREDITASNEGVLRELARQRESMD